MDRALCRFLSFVIGRMANVSSRLMKGSLWISFARALVNALTAVSTFVLARFLSPGDFGLVALGTTMLVIVTTVTELSLSQALVRHAAPDDTHFSAAWTLNAGRGLILCLLFALFAWPAARLYGEPRLVEIMIALGFSVLLGGLINPRRVMLQRELVFWQDFVLSVSQKLAGVTVSIAVAVIYQSYWALILGTLAMQLTNVVVSYMVLPFRPRIMFRHTRELLSFSVWLTLGQIVNTLNWRFDFLLVGKLLGNVALGHYSVGGNLAQLPTRETTAPLTQTIFPAFAKVKHDPARLAQAYQRVQAIVTAMALPMGIGTALVADPLVRLAMGERWVPVIFIVQALASVYALQTLGSLVQPLAMATGHTRALFVRNTQMLAMRIPIVIAGMTIAGLKGLIIARVLSGLLSIPMNMMLVRRLTGLSPLDQLAANKRACCASAVMALGTVAIESRLPRVEGSAALLQQLLLLGAAGAAFYVATSAALWLLEGRPLGPEQEVQRTLRQLTTKLI